MYFEVLAAYCSKFQKTMKICYNIISSEAQVESSADLRLRLMQGQTKAQISTCPSYDSKDFIIIFSETLYPSCSKPLIKFL